LELNTSKPWYREPWTWFLITPIAVTMVVGFTMLGIAIKTSDGLVSDDYYRQGVLYNEYRARDELASTLGIAGSLTMDEITGDLLLLVDFGKAEPVETIMGALRSPTRARDDIEFELTAVRPGYFLASLDTLAVGPKNLELLAPDGSWRISERILLPLKGPVDIAP